jgi:hypothetical protein
MKDKDQVRQVVSKERIQHEIKKSINTTMIGALASAEKFFGFLWGYESDPSLLTDEQKEFLDLYESFRSEVLDKGNIQIRNLPNVLDPYEIQKKTYTYKFPMQPLNPNQLESYKKD